MIIRFQRFLTLLLTKRESAAKISAEGKIKTKPNLSMLALISFIASFVVARLFTTFNPDTVLISGDFHIHHFWYGLALLAIGGWLGITVENEQVNRLAAILFGAGGGLIGDEFGLLLTLEDYWTGITYTFVIIFVTFASMLILIKTYSSIIRREFAEFLSSNASLYLGVFLAAVSVAFSMETSNVIIITVSILLTIIAVIIVLAYLVQRLRRDRG
jgi:hypothetical protein